MRLTSRLRRVERRPDGTCRICRGAVAVPLIESKEWQDLRHLILVALDPFPEAKQAVADALREDAP